MNLTCNRSGPREDATRIGSAGVVRRQAVDISPLRRVNQVGTGLNNKVTLSAGDARPLSLMICIHFCSRFSLTASSLLPPPPQAIYLLTTGAREAAFRNIKTVAECLADELVNAAKGSSNR